MTQAENYIAIIDETLRAYDDHSAGDLVKEIVAVFSGADSKKIWGLIGIRAGRSYLDR